MLEYVEVGCYRFVAGEGADESDLIFIRDNLNLWSFDVSFNNVLNFLGDGIYFEMYVSGRKYAFGSYVDFDVVEVRRVC